MILLEFSSLLRNGTPELLTSNPLLPDKCLKTEQDGIIPNYALEKRNSVQSFVYPLRLFVVKKEINTKGKEGFHKGYTKGKEFLMHNQE